VKTLREMLKDYVAMRRSLGFKMSVEEARLPKFVSFMENNKASCITTRLTTKWAYQASGRCGPTNRLQRVRGFARYVAAFNPKTEVLPPGLFSTRYIRPRPYLYSDEDVRRLMQAARTRSKRERPSGRYYCLFGLLAVSGLRIGEAIRLEVQDVDLTSGILTIRGTKFGKSRLVPLHPTTANELRRYKKRRDEFLEGRVAAPFFISRNGTRLCGEAVYRVFHQLSVKVGLRKSAVGCSPRLHGFRHRFAVRTLIDWYRKGEDVERRLPVLSAFLGHVLVSHTYWYLTECPELMRLAAQRLESRWEERS
jgi:integrase/recombinase XerD